MSNKKKHKTKITKQDALNMERAARRQVDIELGVPHFKHKAHKMATDYNRQKYKQFKIEE